MTSNFEDAELYITQSITIRSNLLLQQQLATKSSLELLKEVYSVKNDSMGYEYIGDQLRIIKSGFPQHD